MTTINLNKRDTMTVKGDQQRPQIGSQNGNAKLNEQDVEIIRWRAKKKRELLEKIDLQIDELRLKRLEITKSDSINQMSLDFEVSQSTIKNVLYRSDIWGHV